MAKKTAKKKSSKQKSPADPRFAEALERAKEALKKPTVSTWEDAHNVLFSHAGGALCGLFPTEAERRAFSASAEWQEINRLIDQFPRSGPVKAEDTVSGRILVRVPKSVHAELLSEALREGCSLNQLCVAKLSRPLSSVNRIR